LPVIVRLPGSIKLRPGTTKLRRSTTSLGTGLMVQEYMSMNPKYFVDMLLNEITKEEVEYGYKYSEKTVMKKVGDITFKGKQAVTTFPGAEWTRSVLSYGGRDRGILISTFIEKDNYETEKDLIEHFWRSMELKVNFK